jgi:SAM-dependent methyltransferase
MSPTPSGAIRVFVGTEEAQEVPAAVLRHSLRSRASAPVEFHDLRGLATGMEGTFYTGFSFYRWAIPSLCGFAGDALYVDADVVVLGDVADLLAIPMEDHTHLCRPRPERDEWFTSVMRLDCARLSHWRFAEWVERAKADPEFYRTTMWCARGGPTREGVGPLPVEWNHLDEHVAGRSQAVHFTKVRDQPWKRPGHPHERVFLDALRAALDADEPAGDRPLRERLLEDARAGFVHAGLPAAVGVAPPRRRERPADVETVRVPLCPSCGGSRATRWCGAHDRRVPGAGQEFPYARCGDCGAVFASVRPVDALVSLTDAEPSGSFVEGVGEGAAPVPRAGSGRDSVRPTAAWKGLHPRRDFKRWLDGVYESVPQGSTFVDYGCGGGAYLDRARGAGLRTVGIDSSAAAREHTARNGHLALPAEPDAWDAVADGSVAFVRMHHVLERLAKPREVLRALRRKMAPGATIHVAVPNPEGLSARMFRSAWHGLDCPRHTVLYPPAALERLLRGAGFREVRVVHEPLAKDHLRSWEYVLEGVGLLPRDGGDRLRRSRPLRLLASLPTAIAARSGRADRLHAVAQA